MIAAERTAERGNVYFRESLEPRRNPWLGRQDSNLRMPVPKTGLTPAQKPRPLRNARVVHRLISIAYGKSAERISRASGASA